MQPKCLEIANAVRQDDTAMRTRAAISELEALGKRISFYSVAKRAQVARSTLYRREDLRALVANARRGTAISKVEPADTKDAKLEAQLAQLVRERDELQQALRNMKRCEYAFIHVPDAA